LPHCEPGLRIRLRFRPRYLTSLSPRTWSPRALNSTTKSRADDLSRSHGVIRRLSLRACVNVHVTGCCETHVIVIRTYMFGDGVRCGGRGFVHTFLWSSTSRPNLRMQQLGADCTDTSCILRLLAICYVTTPQMCGKEAILCFHNCHTDKFGVERIMIEFRGTGEANVGR
jgi:hypothetical protein